MNLRMFNKDDMRAYIRVKVEDRIMNDVDYEIRCSIDTHSFMNPHDTVWITLDNNRIPRLRNIIKNIIKQELKEVDIK